MCGILALEVFMRQKTADTAIIVTAIIVMIIYLLGWLSGDAIQKVIATNSKAQTTTETVPATVQEPSVSVQNDVQTGDTTPTPQSSTPTTVAPRNYSRERNDD